MVEVVSRSHTWPIFRRIFQFFLIGIIIFGIIIGVSFAVAYSGLLPFKKMQYEIFGLKSQETHSFRLERLKSALTVLQHIDESIDPCDNFYKFACGTFLNTTKIPKNAQQENKFSRTYVNNLNRLLKNIIEIDKYTAPRAFQLVRTLFDTCMNNYAIEQIGVKTLTKILKKFGEWPVLDSDKWNETSFTWEKFISDTHGVGLFLSVFFNVNVIHDLMNNSVILRELDQPVLELSKLQFSQGINGNRDVKAYYKFMTDIAKVLRSKSNETEIKDELLDLLNFEIALSKITTDRSTRQIMMNLYNPMTFKDIETKWPSIDWNTILNKPFESYVNLNDNSTIIITDKRFISNLEKLMEKTPKRVQKNFILWRSIKWSVEYLDSKIRRIYANYRDMQVQNVSNLKCINIVRRHLQFGSDALYIQKNLKKNIKKHVDEMVEHIKNRMINVLSSIEWFDEKTRINAVNKARAILSFVGYSEELMSDTTLTEYYEKLTLKNNDYLQCMLNIRIFNKEKLFSSMRMPYDKTHWTTMKSFIDVNALNMHDRNTIMVLGGILQDAFVSAYRPSYLNYGAIGSIIGHEFFHSFDDIGSHYDKNGNLFNWWTDSTKMIFNKKAKCFIDQFSNYTIEEINVRLNGFITQGETIADGGGMRIAYLAYKDWVLKHGHEANLPELPYTVYQLYWISTANLWCSVDTPQWLMNLITDPHPPGPLRVNGALSNIPEFAQDFKCSAGSNMNSINKCTLW